MIMWMMRMMMRRMMVVVVVVVPCVDLRAPHVTFLELFTHQRWSVIVASLKMEHTKIKIQCP